MFLSVYFYQEESYSFPGCAEKSSSSPCELMTSVHLYEKEFIDRVGGRQVKGGGKEEERAPQTLFQVCFSQHAVFSCVVIS